MKSLFKLFLIPCCAALLPTLFGAEEPVVTKSASCAAPAAEHDGMLPPPPPPPQSPEKFRRGPGMWKAFSRLSDQEKRELMKLQRSDPDQFRAVMQAKADRLYQEERAARRELEAMAKQFRASTNEAEKAEIRVALRAKLKADFEQRLLDMRRNLEENRQRTARMENELKKREGNADAIVDAMLADMLSGKRSHRDRPQP